MGRSIGRALLALGLSGTLLLVTGGCAASGVRAAHSTLQFRPVLATVSQVGSGPLTDDELETLDTLDCATLEARTDTPAAEPVTACDDSGEGYLLGPAELDSADVADASASPPPTGTTQGWSILLTLGADGAARLADVTARLLVYPGGDPRNRLALVLDGRIITAPSVNAAITAGQLLIAGDFTEASAKQLAHQISG